MCVCIILEPAVQFWICGRQKGPDSSRKWIIPGKKYLHTHTYICVHERTQVLAHVHKEWREGGREGERRGREGGEGERGSRGVVGHQPLFKMSVLHHTCSPGR